MPPEEEENDGMVNVAQTMLMELLGENEEGDAAVETVDETASADHLFTRSTCTCPTCRSMNEAVDRWGTVMSAVASSGNGSGRYVPPVLQCVLRAIDRTAPAVEALEEDKQFVHRPPSSGT